jgi:4'-phosphopantetheinyl transferase
MVKGAMSAMYIGRHAPDPGVRRRHPRRMSADPTQPWRTAEPDDPPALGADAVHLWRVRLDSPLGGEVGWDLLSDDERVRARRFFQEHHRRRFVAAHGVLRRVLAGYTAQAARELRFTVGPHGKPALAESAVSGAKLEFNLSHSADLAVIAVAWERPVGVDLERWKHEMDHLALAERFFSPAERASLRQLADRQGDLVHGFFAAWSRKEAYLKARGEGVMRGLHHFDVTLAPDEPARVVADRLDSAVHRWRMRSFVPEPGYSGAIVVADPLEELFLLDAR